MTTTEVAMQLAVVSDLLDEGIELLRREPQTDNVREAIANFERAQAHFRAELESPPDEDER